MNTTQTTFPYSDGRMTFNPASRRYVITEQGLIDGSVELRERIERHGADASRIISSFCELISQHIYTFIHQFHSNVMRVDAYISKCGALRSDIYNAQLEQAKYVFFNGDLTLSPKPEERANYLSPLAAAILRDVGLTYAGGC